MKLNCLHQTKDKTHYLEGMEIRQKYCSDIYGQIRSMLNFEFVLLRELVTRANSIFQTLRQPVDKDDTKAILFV